MKYDHAKPLIEKLMHIAVLYHASSGMLRTKIFDALKEFIPDMDDGCFERGCPAIDHFSSHTTTQDDDLKEMDNPMEHNADYERGFIDGRADQMKSSVDRAVNRMAPREWVGIDHEQMRNTSLEFNRGALWAERYLKEKNNGN